MRIFQGCKLHTILQDMAALERSHGGRSDLCCRGMKGWRGGRGKEDQVNKKHNFLQDSVPQSWGLAQHPELQGPDEGCLEGINVQAREPPEALLPGRHLGEELACLPVRLQKAALSPLSFKDNH